MDALHGQCPVQHCSPMPWGLVEHGLMLVWRMQNTDVGKGQPLNGLSLLPARRNGWSASTEVAALDTAASCIAGDDPWTEPFWEMSATATEAVDRAEEALGSSRGQHWLGHEWSKVCGDVCDSFCDPGAGHVARRRFGWSADHDGGVDSRTSAQWDVVREARMRARLATRVLGMVHWTDQAP